MIRRFARWAVYSPAHLRAAVLGSLVTLMVLSVAATGVGELMSDDKPASSASSTASVPPPSSEGVEERQRAAVLSVGTRATQAWLASRARLSPFLAPTVGRVPRAPRARLVSVEVVALNPFSSVVRAHLTDATKLVIALGYDGDTWKVTDLTTEPAVEQ